MGCSYLALMSDVHSRTDPRMHLQALLAEKLQNFKNDESNLHEKIIDFEKVAK